MSHITPPPRCDNCGAQRESVKERDDLPKSPKLCDLCYGEVKPT
jgi:hypothetical protein